MTTSERPAPAKETGLAENVAATAPLSTENSAVLALLLPLPLRWARALIEGADGPIPPYGSADWSALPDDSRAKVASCVMAAERWRTRHHQADPFPMSQSRRAREIAEARRPRPGDHPGGPVVWDEVASGE